MEPFRCYRRSYKNYMKEPFSIECYVVFYFIFINYSKVEVFLIYPNQYYNFQCQIYWLFPSKCLFKHRTLHYVSIENKGGGCVFFWLFVYYFRLHQVLGCHCRVKVLRRVYAQGTKLPSLFSIHFLKGEGVQCSIGTLRESTYS